MEGPNSQDQVVNAATPAPPPTLTVAAVARRLGVAPPTLRTWDRRYGLGPSAHTAGAHRRYSPADVARLMVMRRLTLEGVSPADAAKIALATSLSDDGRPMHTPAEGYDLAASAAEAVREVGAEFDAQDGFFPTDAPTMPGSIAAVPEFDAGDPEPADPEGPVDDLGLLDNLDEVEPFLVEDDEDELPAWGGVLRSVPSERGTPGGGRVVALPDGTPQSRGLARAAMSLDTYETNRLLRDMIRREGVVRTWNSMIMPVLRALGERTRVTGDGIDVEHAFSEVILGVMRTVSFSVPPPGNAPVVLLACADADYHSLPLHALAAALAERGIPTRMLGSGLPPQALSASVRRTGPSVIVLFARMEGADARETEALRRQRPAPTLILAGPGWLPETVPAAARTAGSLMAAVDEVLRAVHA